MIMDDHIEIDYRRRSVTDFVTAQRLAKVT